VRLTAAFFEKTRPAHRLRVRRDAAIAFGLALWACGSSIAASSMPHVREPNGEHV
jgi:hypothetical protein